MARWVNRAECVLVFFFILLYIAAKVHFFVRYGAIGLGGYLKEHSWLWGGMAAVAALAGVVDWLRRRRERRQKL